MKIGKKALFPRGGIIVYRIGAQQPGRIKKQDRIEVKIQLRDKPSQKAIDQEQMNDNSNRYNKF